MHGWYAGVGLILVGGCGLFPGAEADQPRPNPARSLDAALSEVAEQARRSVVNVATTRTVTPEELGDDRMFDGLPVSDVLTLGSGVIVDPDGVVLTNAHLIRGAQEIEVTLHDGSRTTASLVGADLPSDLAVLRLDDPPASLRPLAIGDSSALRLGQIVLAVGDPRGVGQTVTMGIVSATGRSNLGLVDYEDFVQTDAAIHPDSSGGALVNLNGELVGIPAPVASRAGGSCGVGFAIPADMARRVMEQLVESGRVSRGWLGASTQDLHPELAELLGLDEPTGVLVSHVDPHGPAATAGLHRGDVVERFDGHQVRRSVELRLAVASAGPGSPFTLEVRRRGDAHVLTGALGTFEDHEPERPRPVEPGNGGLSVGTLTPHLRGVLEVPSKIDGVVVFVGRGLFPGDVIVEVDRRPVRSATELDTRLADAGPRALLLVWRGGATRFVVLNQPS